VWAILDAPARIGHNVRLWNHQERCAEPACFRVAGNSPRVLPGRTVRGYAANERLNVALVGVGGRGSWFVDTVPAAERMVALCDVNDQHVAEVFPRWKESADKLASSTDNWERARGAELQRLVDQPPATFRDFRRMLDEMGDRIDAVIVSTPDHTHAVASAAAIRAGKHVFCEKPLTRTVHASRVLRELAREHQVATSMGNQGTASGQFRRALELLRDGTLGTIEEVHVWNDAGGADRRQPPQGSEPVPEHFDWDLWLGPAAARPYHRQWLQRNAWRDFGTCQLGNWATHTANLAFMALKVHELWLNPSAEQSRNVIRVRAECSGVNRLSFPSWERVEWEIPARAEFPPITFRWYNGGGSGARDIFQPLMRDAVGLVPRERDGLQWSGALIVGTQGRMVLTGHNATFCLLPDDQLTEVDKDRPQHVDASRGHEADWFAACRGGKPAWANFDYASALNEFLMLGNVATQCEEPLEFDPVAMKVVNNAQADTLLHCEYREGWVL
jgi:hypothetical protein